jgi:hypothetical protein
MPNFVRRQWRRLALYLILLFVRNLIHCGVQTVQHFWSAYVEGRLAPFQAAAQLHASNTSAFFRSQQSSDSTSVWLVENKSKAQPDVQRTCGIGRFCFAALANFTFVLKVF